MSYQPADAAGAAALAVQASRALAAAGQADMVWGPLRRWGGERDTVAKRADVWSERQLQAGWEYLLRRAAQAH